MIDVEGASLAELAPGIWEAATRQGLTTEAVLTTDAVLAWRETPDGRRWSAISRALCRGDHAWAFRLLCQEMTPVQATVALAVLIETERG